MIVDVQVRTISCDSCDKSTTFNVKDAQQAVNDNPWLNATRVVQRIFDGKNFTYCSDECELSAVSNGSHNPPEQKKIVEVAGSGSSEAIKIAADAAKKAEEATKAIKQGQPAKLTVVPR